MTVPMSLLLKFVGERKSALDHFKVIAITHRLNGLNEVGKFHITDVDQSHRLNNLKTFVNLDELMYLSTCNRVEFYFVTKQKIDEEFHQLITGIVEETFIFMTISSAGMAIARYM